MVVRLIDIVEEACKLVKCFDDEDPEDPEFVPYFFHVLLHLMEILPMYMSFGYLQNQFENDLQRFLKKVEWFFSRDD